MLATDDPTREDSRRVFLHVQWNPVGTKWRPTHADLKDPLLFGVWQLLSGMVFCVAEQPSGTREIFAKRRDALKRFNQLAREIPRRKKIDYGFPVDESSDRC